MIKADLDIVQKVVDTLDKVVICLYERGSIGRDYSIIAAQLGELKDTLK